MLNFTKKPFNMKRSFTLFLSLILMTGWVHAQNLFLPSVVDSTVNGPAGVCITDLDKDGLPDILCAASDGDKINGPNIRSGQDIPMPTK